MAISFPFSVAIQRGAILGAAVFLAGAVLLGSTEAGGGRQVAPPRTSAEKYAGEWHLVRKPVRRVRVTLITRRDCPDEPVATWDAIAAAIPDLPQQKAVSSELRMNGVPMPRSRVREDSPAHVSILAATLTQTDHPEWQEASAVYEAVLYSQVLTPGPAPEPIPDLSPAERRLCLANTTELPFRSTEFQAWMRQHDLFKRDGESDLVFGNRVYREVRTRFAYSNPKVRTDTVVEDTQCMTGDCGNFSRLVVAVCRANGIPARLLFGHWVTGGKNTYPEGQPHVRSEFWAPGIGWVMADASAGLSPAPYQPERDVDICFGVDYGNFLALHESSNLSLPTPHFGHQPQWHLQNIYTPCVNGTWEKPKWTHTEIVEESPIESGAR